MTVIHFRVLHKPDCPNVVAGELCICRPETKVIGVEDRPDDFREEEEVYEEAAKDQLSETT
jgi:hypothetical protein